MKSRGEKGKREKKKKVGMLRKEKERMWRKMKGKDVKILQGEERMV